MARVAVTSARFIVLGLAPSLRPEVVERGAGILIVHLKEHHERVVLLTEGASG
eukprot:CAMPEP_0177672578 /NCGR_PEP_ID=MMETSP0447-20121125/25426_1 /TAXON_ID=0 /ORGANISM="Stygamoeba regulata, Strain BSH-02190019" /LENGTH=52 /DNA_ID=CAMNT_0019180275 /DNA_START=42 /DNA_END=200 /DNA_ORIENTATION=+